METLLCILLLVDICINVVMSLFVKRRVIRYQQRFNQQQQEIDHLNEDIQQLYRIINNEPPQFYLHEN